MNESLETQRYRAIAECIGHLTLSWAYLELVIDGCISLTHVHIEGKSLEERRPKVFSHKIKYLVEGAKEMQQLKFLSPYIPFLVRMNELADHRNWLIHGHLLKFYDDQSIDFARQSIREKFPKIESKKFQFDEIQSYTKEVRNLAALMRELMDTLLDVTEPVDDKA